MIQISNVSKIYNQSHSNVKVQALSNISIKIEKGEFVSIVGRSGSGKSTLINLIGGLDSPTNGKIEVDGVNIATLSSVELALYRNKKVGFVFQSYYLESAFSVLRNYFIAINDFWS